MPRTPGAPLGPAMRHCVCLKARRICWRSASSSVEMEEAEDVKEAKEVKDDEESAPEAASEMDLASERGTRSTWPGETHTAPSLSFSISHPFPSHNACSRV